MHKCSPSRDEIRGVSGTFQRASDAASRQWNSISFFSACYYAVSPTSVFFNSTESSHIERRSSREHDEKNYQKEWQPPLRSSRKCSSSSSSSSGQQQLSGDSTSTSWQYKRLCHVDDQKSCNTNRTDGGLDRSTHIIINKKIEIRCTDALNRFFFVCASEINDFYTDFFPWIQILPVSITLKSPLLLLMPVTVPCEGGHVV